MWAAQGSRASLPAAMATRTTLRCCGRRTAAGRHCLQPWRLHCAAVGSTGLQGYAACGYGDYTTLLWAAQGCRVALPAAMATTLRYYRRRRAAGPRCLRRVTTLRCCGQRRAAGRHCLWPWRMHCADVGGTRQQGFIGCGYGDYSALLWAAHGCRAALPAAMATSRLHCDYTATTLRLHGD